MTGPCPFSAAGRFRERCRDAEQQRALERMTTTKEQTMDEVTQALSPCPFCRGEKFQQNTKAKGYFVKRAAQREGKDQSNHLIRCNKCGAKGPLSKSPAEAIAAWNTRATIAQQGVELARMREALGWIKAHAIKLRKGTDDWFELVEIEAAATTALESPKS